MADGNENGTNEKIEVWANPVGPGIPNNPVVRAVGQEAYHTTTVYTDIKGGVHYVEGQPQKTPDGFGGYAASWGTITTKSGDFKSLAEAVAAGDNPMANPYATKSLVKEGPDLSIDFKNITAVAHYQETLGIAYGAFTTNSNGFNYTSIKGAGLTPPELPDRPTYGVPNANPGTVNAIGWGVELIDLPNAVAGPSALGMSLKEFKDYGPGTGSITSAAASMSGMSFKEAKDYGPGTASATSAAVNSVGTPSIASTLDMHGIAAPSAGLTGTVSVGGVAHSNFGSVSISSVGIGTPVGAAPTSNFATPSLAAAMEMHAQQAAAAAAAAARHEAFVARTEMEADILNNQQLAEINAKHAVEATVDRWAAAADFYGAVPAVDMTGPQVFDPYSGGMVSAPAGDFDMSPGGAGWGGFAATSWSDFCASQGLSVTSGLSLDADNIGSLSGDFPGSGGFGYSEGTASFSGGWSDSLTDAAPGADPNDTGGDGYGGGYDGGYGGYGGVAGGDNIGDSDDSGSDHASNDSGGYGGGYSGGGPDGAGYGGEDRDNFSGGYGGGYGGSTAESSSSSSESSSSSSSSSESSSGNSGGVGGGAGSASEGSGSFAPVVLDLDGDGVELVDASAGAQYDTNDDGTRERLGWAGKDDGLLAIDLDGDGKITGAKELSFAMHTAEEGDTDLEGLAKVFDSNKDGVLDANDVEFDKFRIWQDKDGDGISDAGEVKTLAEMGIKSIGVVSDGKAYTDAGNTVHGTASYTKTDGTTKSVGDVDFKIAGKGNKPTAIDDEDSDDEEASFERSARQALSGKMPTRLPEMSTSGGAIAMAAALGIAAVETSNAGTGYARAA